MPILDRIEAKLDELTGRVLPKSAIGKAVTYARNQWAALRRYTGDGRLTIDNNVSERTLRLQAIGRNYAQFPFMRSPRTPALDRRGRRRRSLRIISSQPIQESK